MSLFPANFFKYFSNELSVVRGKYTQNQLTQWPTFHFLCRDRKDRQHLDHNLNNHVRHSCSRREDSVYLKSAEETFDAIKDVDYLFLVIALYSRLGALMS